MWFCFAVLGNQPDQAVGGIGGTDFYVPVYTASVIAAIGLIGLPMHLASYKEGGVPKRMRASGIATSEVLAARAALTGAVVTVGAVLLLGVGFAAYELSPPDAAIGVAFGFIGGIVSFAAVGVGLAALLPGARVAQSVGLFRFFGILSSPASGRLERFCPTGSQLSAIGF